MLDRDLAELYGVEVGQLNRQVKRNIERFPDDFMFQLSREDCSRCQIGTLNGGRGSNIKYLPHAFTENGVAMLSGVLRSPRAISANIQIMRAFVTMRRTLATLAPLLSRIEATERRQLKQEDAQARNEERFKLILDAMQDKRFPPQKHGEYAIVEMCKQTLRRFKISGLEAANRTDDNPVVLSPIGKIAVGDENHQKRRLFHPRHVNLAGDGEKR